MEKKLASYTKLPEGWHYGSGGPISAETIKTASELAKFLAPSATKVDSAPGQNYEIIIAAEIGGEYIEVVVRQDRSCMLIRDNDDSDTDTILSLSQVKETIKGLMGALSDRARWQRHSRHRTQTT